LYICTSFKIPTGDVIMQTKFPGKTNELFIYSMSQLKQVGRIKQKLKNNLVVYLTSLSVNWAFLASFTRVLN
jgi:hypothetical protein